MVESFDIYVIINSQQWAVSILNSKLGIIIKHQQD